jgi:hypothetical protein
MLWEPAILGGGKGMKVHIGWIGAVIVVMLLLWYFNPSGVVCSVKNAI